MANYNRYQTGLWIVRTAMSRCDLEQPSTIEGTVEDTVAKFLVLLNFVGQQIVESYPWQRMEKVWTLVTDGSLSYATPEDFDRFVPDTEWNNSTRFPLAGPLSASQWNALVARGLGAATFQLYYKYQNDQITFYAEPSASPQTLAMAYYQRGWVYDADGAGTTKDFVSKNTDQVLLHPLLMAVGVALKWKQDRGFDTTSLQGEFDALASTSTAKDNTASTVIMGRTGGATPLLGASNVPVTNFGS